MHMSEVLIAITDAAYQKKKIDINFNWASSLKSITLDFTYRNELACFTGKDGMIWFPSKSRAMMLIGCDCLMIESCVIYR